jgi:hypothetical protein
VQRQKGEGAGRRDHTVAPAHGKREKDRQDESGDRRPEAQPPPVVAAEKNPRREKKGEAWPPDGGDVGAAVRREAKRPLVEQGPREHGVVIREGGSSRPLLPCWNKPDRHDEPPEHGDGDRRGDRPLDGSGARQVGFSFPDATGTSTDSGRKPSTEVTAPVSSRRADSEAYGSKNASVNPALPQKALRAQGRSSRRTLKHLPPRFCDG